MESNIQTKNENLRNILEKLKKQIKEQENNVSTLDSDLSKFCFKVDSIKSVQSNLSKNLSALYECLGSEFFKKEETATKTCLDKKCYSSLNKRPRSPDRYPYDCYKKRSRIFGNGIKSPKRRSRSGDRYRYREGPKDRNKSDCYNDENLAKKHKFDNVCDVEKKRKIGEEKSYYNKYFDKDRESKEEFSKQTHVTASSSTVSREIKEKTEDVKTVERQSEETHKTYEEEIQETEVTITKFGNYESVNLVQLQNMKQRIISEIERNVPDTMEEKTKKKAKMDKIKIDHVTEKLKKRLEEAHCSDVLNVCIENDEIKEFEEKFAEAIEAACGDGEESDPKNEDFCTPPYVAEDQTNSNLDNTQHLIESKIDSNNDNKVESNKDVQKQISNSTNLERDKSCEQKREVTTENKILNQTQNIVKAECSSIFKNNPRVIIDKLKLDEIDDFKEKLKQDSETSMKTKLNEEEDSKKQNKRKHKGNETNLKLQSHKSKENNTNENKTDKENEISIKKQPNSSTDANVKKNKTTKKRETDFKLNPNSSKEDDNTKQNEILNIKDKAKDNEIGTELQPNLNKDNQVKDNERVEEEGLKLKSSLTKEDKTYEKNKTSNDLQPSSNKDANTNENKKDKRKEMGFELKTNTNKDDRAKQNKTAKENELNIELQPATSKGIDETEKNKSNSQKEATTKLKPDSNNSNKDDNVKQGTINKEIEPSIKLKLKLDKNDDSTQNKDKVVETSANLGKEEDNLSQIKIDAENNLNVSNFVSTSDHEEIIEALKYITIPEPNSTINNDNGTNFQEKLNLSDEKAENEDFEKPKCNVSEPHKNDEHKTKIRERKQKETPIRRKPNVKERDLNEGRKSRSKDNSLPKRMEKDPEYSGKIDKIDVESIESSDRVLRSRSRRSRSTSNENINKPIEVVEEQSTQDNLNKRLELLAKSQSTVNLSHEGEIPVLHLKEDDMISSNLLNLDLSFHASTPIPEVELQASNISCNNSFEIDNTKTTNQNSDNSSVLSGGGVNNKSKESPRGSGSFRKGRRVVTVSMIDN